MALSAPALEESREINTAWPTPRSMTMVGVGASRLLPTAVTSRAVS